MMIQNSILAGDILSILETARRSVSMQELKYLLREPLHRIQAAVERLQREGLAVVDASAARVKHAALAASYSRQPHRINQVAREMAVI